MHPFAMRLILACSNPYGPLYQRHEGIVLQAGMREEILVEAASVFDNARKSSV